MRDGVRRYGGLMGSLIVSALIGGFAASWMTGPRGLPGPLLLVGGERGGGAVLAVLVLLVALTAVAVVASRLVNSAVGLFVLGCGLGVLAMRSGGAVDLAFSGVAPGAIGAETILWGVLLLPVVLAVFLLGGMLPDVPSEDGDSRSALAGAFSRPAIAACIAGAVAIPVAWIVLRNDLKGQAIAAAVIGGLAAGTVGRLWSPRTQPILLVTATLVALGIAQVVMSRLLGQPFDAAFVRNVAPRLLMAAPVDLAAGTLAGVGMGLGWARSFMRDPREQPVSDLRRSTAAGRMA